MYVYSKYQRDQWLTMHFFVFQAEDGIRDYKVTGVQTCALPICSRLRTRAWAPVSCTGCSFGGVVCQQKTSSPSGGGGSSANPEGGLALRDKEYLVLGDADHDVLHLGLRCTGGTSLAPRHSRATIPATWHAGKRSAPAGQRAPGSWAGSQDGRPASKAVIAASCRSVSATSSSPSSSRQRAKSGSAKGSSRPADGMATVRSATSTTTSASGSAASAANIAATVAASAWAGTSPELMALPRKMSAKPGDTTAAKPKSCSAQTACSRDEPQAKLSPATSTLEPAAPARFSTNPGSWRQAPDRPGAKPVRSTRFSQAAGMIWSVSTSSRSRATARPAMRATPGITGLLAG